MRLLLPALLTVHRAAGLDDRARCRRSLPHARRPSIANLPPWSIESKRFRRNRPLTLRVSISHNRSNASGGPVGRRGKAKMGTVVRFPAAVRAACGKSIAGKFDSATIIILPVVRVERYRDEPFEREPSRAQRRRRRRRASRP